MAILSRTHRTARLLSLPAGALGLSAVGLVRRLAGADPDVVRRELRARNAKRTRLVLGDLKGGAQGRAAAVHGRGAVPRRPGGSFFLELANPEGSPVRRHRNQLSQVHPRDAR